MVNDFSGADFAFGLWPLKAEKAENGTLIYSQEKQQPKDEPNFQFSTFKLEINVQLKTAMKSCKNLLSLYKAGII